MRFGAVAYLNARPLIEGLDPLVLDTPSRLVTRFERGEMDVALLPVAAGEAAGLTRVGSLGVTADGDVESVLLFLRCPIDAVTTVALDPASRTSRVLAQIILREQFGRAIEITEAPADAELVIGDPALRRAHGEHGATSTVDLAGTWRAWTGLPFVFAAWYGDPAAAPLLDEAYRRGDERIDVYAGEAAPDVGLPVAALARYLRTCIRYRIGPREEQGLARFLEAGRRLDLL